MDFPPREMLCKKQKEMIRTIKEPWPNLVKDRWCNYSMRLLYYYMSEFKKKIPDVKGHFSSDLQKYIFSRGVIFLSTVYSLDSL